MFFFLRINKRNDFVLEQRINVTFDIIRANTYEGVVLYVTILLHNFFGAANRSSYFYDFKKFFTQQLQSAAWIAEPRE